VNAFHPGLHRSADIWLNASRTATGEIFNIPLKGEYISIMIKNAAETAIAQRTSVTITVELEGAKAILVHNDKEVSNCTRETYPSRPVLRRR
jgi:hypothetical protein